MPTSEEQQILRLLAKEWDHSGPPGIMDVKRHRRVPGSSSQRHHAGTEVTVSNRHGRYECAQNQRVSDP